ncbi:hypothetical protein BVH03_08485 [Pseudomonas sp. PA15(2017)]|uniref:hypothetical protein n=1 Tax=Pseudomonas sp. PA15(2017) TaxID=1932111 RepID=UPI0009642258|nr:hypothetical protein [Pseudomonas sp. PA15(2017)]OLU31500.1 hypothetical protein BVH03_08485 [Pseudomonas sp. PA15(2017)]
MIDAPNLQPRSQQSAELAALMATYERQHGPVQTLPIVTAGNKQLPFVITSPGKPKAKPSRALRQRDHKHAELNTAKKRKAAERLEILHRMAPAGASINEMCDATGLSAKTVMDRLRDHRIKRGPKMDLSA